jgi:hypothetical protein
VLAAALAIAAWSGLARSASAAQLPDPLAHPGAFANPPMDVRPGFRWFWSDAYGEMPFDRAAGLQELRAMAKAGFGRVEIAWGHDYGNATQRGDLGAVVDAARGHHMRVDQTLGTIWPWHTPDTTGELGVQELMYGRRDVSGPTHFSGPVPPAIGDSEPTGVLVAVTAARVVRAGPPVTQVDRPPASPTILDPASLVDLTARTADDGTVTWDVPAGDWILFAFYRRSEGGDQVNPIGRASTAAGLNYVAANQVGSVGPKLPGVGGSFFEDSLEYSADELYWSSTLPAQFRTRRGYDMTKYLPLMFVQTVSDYPVPQTEPVPDFDLPHREGARYRHDYYETITDLYIHDHIEPIERWAHRYGMHFRAQVAYGADLDTIRSARGIARAGGLADDESLNAGDTPFVPGRAPGYADRSDPWARFAMDHYRQVTSGSQQAGGLEISSELGAWVGRDLSVTLDDLRRLMDKEWAAGLTRPIVCGYAHSPRGFAWPGLGHFAGVIGESFNFRTQPQWRMFRPLADYWGRGALVLQQGAARTDVAVLRDSFVTTAAGPSRPPKRFFDSSGLEDAGFTIGYVDPVGVREAKVGRDGSLFPAGPRYRVLVVDGSQTYVGGKGIPGPTTRAIDRASRLGLRVVFVGGPPALGLSGRDPGGEDRQVRAAIAAILARPTTRVVKRQREVAAAVRELRVHPAAEWGAPQPVLTQRRQRGRSSYYYLWNASSRAVSFTGSFKAHGPPSELDLWTGGQSPVRGRPVRGGRWSVPMHLGPRETTVLAFGSGNRRGGDLRLRRVDEQPLRVGPWSLAVESWGPDGRKTLPERAPAHLRPWAGIRGLRNVSGVGTYRATVSIPSSWMASDRRVQLDLGRIDGAVQTYVNGRLATPEIDPTSPVEVTPLLHAGANRVKVVLATTAMNRALTTDSTLVGRPRFATEASLGRQAYGLLGPVRLIPRSSPASIPRAS